MGSSADYTPPTAPAELAVKPDFGDDLQKQNQAFLNSLADSQTILTSNRGTNNVLGSINILGGKNNNNNLT